MINISVLYFACYRHSLHTVKPNPLTSTFLTWADSAEAPRTQAS